MAHVLTFLDPVVLMFVGLPLGLCIAAWTLRMACELAAIDPPDFSQCLSCVVMVLASSFLWRWFVSTSFAHVGIVGQFAGPLVMAVAIIAMVVRTGPFSALMIAIYEGAICATIFFAFTSATSGLL